MFAARYFNLRYYATRYFPKLGGIIIVIGATPDARSAYVGSEVRAARVLSEDRRGFIPADDRAARVR